MIFLDRLTELENTTAKLIGDARKLRVHPDVVQLADMLAKDEAKLQAAAPFIFWPAYETWLEWSDDQGDIGFYFDGSSESVTEGRGVFLAWDRTDSQPITIPIRYDMPGYRLTWFDPAAEATARIGSHRVPPSLATSKADPIVMSNTASMLRPVIWAILALINSPKLIRSQEVDVSRINKKRLKLKRYLFHPHHEVRLNVDKRIITTAAGHGDGGSRALHFVRTHIRFRRGQYELVRPHWRGDCEIGIVDTNYRADRQRSRWKD